MRYKFSPGDLIVTSDHHQYPGHHGILIKRFMKYSCVTWRIHWTTDMPPQYGWGKEGPDVSTELEINLFNLRGDYHYYNRQGEYYENDR